MRIREEYTYKIRIVAKHYKSHSEISNFILHEINPYFFFLCSTNQVMLASNVSHDCIALCQLNITINVVGKLKCHRRCYFRLCNFSKIISVKQLTFGKSSPSVNLTSNQHDLSLFGPTTYRLSSYSV